MTIYERNYKKMLPLLIACNNNVKRDTNYIKIKNGSMMPLVVEYLRDEEGCRIYCMAHNFVQNGDLMADPDMEIKVYKELKAVEALTWQLDSIGKYQQVYSYNEDGRKMVSPRLKRELNVFLGEWLDNIKNQGYLEELIEEEEKISKQLYNSAVMRQYYNAIQI